MLRQHGLVPCRGLGPDDAMGHNRSNSGAVVQNFQKARRPDTVASIERHLESNSMRAKQWLPLSLALIVIGCSQAAAQPRLARERVPVQTQTIDYLQVDGKTFQATIYRPEGTGPFPAILDVHGGAWTREDVGRDEHALFDKALAAMGVVVVAIEYRQSPQHHYPDSVADVNFALRWIRANALKFDASPQMVGVFGSSSGGHLVLLNAMRPTDPRYAALPLAGGSLSSASPDYAILVYPISDPLARRAYAQQVGSTAPVKSTDIYFSPSGSIEDGNPQMILDRREPVRLPPILLLQGSADATGVVNDKNVSPEIQQRFASSYRSAGGKIQLELLPGAPHNFVNAPGAHADHALALIRAFVEERLAGQ
jgi:acetyl esterase/lipase